MSARFRFRPETLTTAGMYLIEAAILAVVFALYQGTGESGSGLSSRKLLLVAAGGVFIGLLAVVLLVAALRTSAANRRSGFWLPVLLNLIVVGLCFGMIEASLRVLARPDPLGQRIGSTVLLPYDWRRLANYNLDLLQRSRSSSAYFVEDDMLGWTIAPARTSSNGLYKSSAEGLRSEVAGSRYAASPAPPRIALVGDSFVFSEEVAFEDSLARFLQEELPSDMQVLNFGVPGYGVDQAVLRFERDVVSWRPEVTVLGFIQDDLYRNMNVYAFLKVGWETPLSKPRFVLDNTRLRLLNVPNLDPDAMFASESIFDLPFLDQDIEFFARQWRTHHLQASYLFRYLISAYPVWPTRNSHTSDEAIAALGSLVIRGFAESARSAGTAPLIVYFPTRGDFQGGARTMKERLLAAAQAGAGPVVIVDLTECLLEHVSPAELFLEKGMHYSREGNAAAAKCIGSMIAPLLMATDV